MTTATMNSPRTLRDLIPRVNNKTASIAINVALMVGFALFTAALAQFSWKLSFTPVPITGQTLAVLLSGATLGWSLGAGSQILYVLMGLVFPFYAHGTHGYIEDKMIGKVFVQGTASTYGYLIGFIFAAALVGYLAQRKNDRNVMSALGAFLVGSLVIYVFGAAWLAHCYNWPLLSGPNSAVAKGVVPYLFGDIVKAAIAGAILPASWAIVKRIRKENIPDA